MSKQYGLIIPGQQKKPVARESSREITKPSIFDESSSESDDNGPPQMQLKKAPLGPSLMERRKAKNLQEKALAEDPTIFQYDELYDEMENKREEEKEIKSKEPKKARYITKLMETAERRKLENELRVERQVQKEREAEGEEFKDKESFVTSAYRKKLEEMRLLEEQNKRDDYLEAIGDVTKQSDLDGFYRHLYEQKMGTSKNVQKPGLQSEAPKSGKDDDETISYKPIKSGKAPQQRAYRKRHSSDEEDDAVTDKTLKEEPDKKMHLTNNIDADSDFSIDDSSSESDSELDDDKNDKQKTSSKKRKLNKDSKETTQVSSEDSKISKTPSNTIALNLKSLQPEEETGTAMSQDPSKQDTKLPIPSVDVEPIRCKADIWRKRTVGDVYIAAIQRYYERKAARYQA